MTKDWDDVPTCTTHILREMGKTLPVLWVNSIGTRKPRLRHPAHMGRVWKRLATGFRRAERKENQLRVLNPLLIPKAESRPAQWINRRLFAWQAGRELRDMGDGRIEYWCFVPNAVDLVGSGRWPAASGGGRDETTNTNMEHRTSNMEHRMSESPNSRIIVYYCVDDWSQFHYLDTEWMARKERELLACADIVFAVSRYLVSKLQVMTDMLPKSNIEHGTSKIQYMPHGVEYDKFRAALESRELPADVAALKKPVIGFYGNIYPWVDLGLVAELARRRPAWSFVLIGGAFCDVARCDGLANVRFLGRREHNELPGYCAAFDVGMIPYDMTQARMESVNPVKTRELLAAGVPIVAADVPELRGLGDRVLIAKRPEEWISAIERQVTRRDRDAISRSVVRDDWSARVREIRMAVRRVSA